MLRALAIAAIAWLLWLSLRPAELRRHLQASDEELARSAASWVRDPAVASIHVQVEATPSGSALAALAALRGAGVDVSWSGEVPAAALSVAPVPEPGDAGRVAIAAPRGSRLEIVDRLGRIDSLTVSAYGAGLMAYGLESPVSATFGDMVAASPRAPPVTLRPILVLARAGWEAKFTIAALEERGWSVRARLAIAPGVFVRQGAETPLDTASLSAIIVLDSSGAAMATPIERYVRSGGGLVLAGGAAAHPALGVLAPARTGGRAVARARLVADSISPSTLTRLRLAALRDHGVALDRGNAEIMVAARREGAGRVVQTGLEDSWRWRMEGGEGSADAHRRYWSRLVASVAYAAASVEPTSHAGPAAPRARVVDALGESRAPAPATTASDPLRLPRVLAIVLLLLLAEWFSRRLRGAK